jgi:hypothetical protein
MSEDIIRVIRILEYVGPRDKIEKQIAYSVHGTKDWGNGVRIRAATLGEFPEILEKVLEKALETEAGNVRSRE